MAGEAERTEAHWGTLWRYKALGLYHEQLSHYYELFDSRQIRVYLFEDLIGNMQATLADVRQFLGIHDRRGDREFKKMPTSSDPNVTPH